LLVRCIRNKVIGNTRIPRGTAFGLKRGSVTRSQKILPVCGVILVKSVESKGQNEKAEDSPNRHFRQLGC
jgi:hypothetical protein